MSDLHARLLLYTQSCGKWKLFSGFWLLAGNGQFIKFNFTNYSITRSIIINGSLSHEQMGLSVSIWNQNPIYLALGLWVVNGNNLFIFHSDQKQTQGARESKHHQLASYSNISHNSAFIFIKFPIKLYIWKHNECIVHHKLIISFSFSWKVLKSSCASQKSITNN